MTEAIIQQTPQALTQPMSAIEIRSRVNAIQEVMKAVMKDDTHYGIIPGTKKPTLYKAGSEVLLSTFRIAVEPIVEDLSTSDEARFRVITRLTTHGGIYLGSGVGEASSNEEKYKWRAAVCDEEWEETAEDRRRIKFGRAYGNSPHPTRTKQVRMNVADVSNTVLKMAKKRSQIDGTLTVLGASDIFAQDLEDMDVVVDAEEGVTEKPAAAPVAMPQRKAEPQEVPPPTARPEPTPHREAPVQSARTPQGDKISEPQAKRFWAICMGNGVTKDEIKNYLRTKWGIDSDRDIVKGSMYDECCRWAGGN
jgi:hypothetical protein